MAIECRCGTAGMQIAFNRTDRKQGLLHQYNSLGQGQSTEEFRVTDDAYNHFTCVTPKAAKYIELATLANKAMVGPGGGDWPPRNVG